MAYLNCLNCMLCMSYPSRQQDAKAGTLRTLKFCQQPGWNRGACNQHHLLFARTWSPSRPPSTSGNRKEIGLKSIWSPGLSGPTTSWHSDGSTKHSPRMLGSNERPAWTGQISKTKHNLGEKSEPLEHALESSCYCQTYVDSGKINSEVRSAPNDVAQKQAESQVVLYKARPRKICTRFGEAKSLCSTCWASSKFSPALMFQCQKAERVAWNALTGHGPIYLPLY